MNAKQLSSKESKK